MKRIKLQIYFILIALFNCLYQIFFPWFLRRLMLLVTGCKIGKKSSIQAGKFFSFGKLTIGTNSIVNSGCYLDNRRGIYIGNNVVIAHDSKIYTLGHEINDDRFATKGRSVHIEDFVIIFSNSLIMPGVTIGRGAVILPGSVVTKNVPEMAIMGGNPVKQINTRTTLHHNKSAYNYWFSL